MSIIDFTIDPGKNYKFTIEELYQIILADTSEHPFFSGMKIFTIEEFKENKVLGALTENNTGKTTFTILMFLLLHEKFLYVRTTQAEIDEFISFASSSSSEFEQFYKYFYFKEYKMYHRETNDLVAVFVGLNAYNKFRSAPGLSLFKNLFYDEFIALPSKTIPMQRDPKLIFQALRYLTRTFSRNELNSFRWFLASNKNDEYNPIFEYLSIDGIAGQAYYDFPKPKGKFFISLGGEFNKGNNALKGTVMEPSEADDLEVNAYFKGNDFIKNPYHHLLARKSQLKDVTEKALHRFKFQQTEFILCELIRETPRCIESAGYYIRPVELSDSFTTYALSLEDVALNKGVFMVADLTNLAEKFLKWMTSGILLFSKPSLMDTILLFISRNINYTDVLGVD